MSDHMEVEAVARALREGGSYEDMARAALQALRALRPAGEVAKYHLIFDGFPGPDGPRFIELENDAGHSIGVGEWVDDPRHPGWAQLVLPVYASAIISALAHVSGTPKTEHVASDMLLATPTAANASEGDGYTFSVEECSLLRQLLETRRQNDGLNHDGLRVYQRLCQIERAASPDTKGAGTMTSYNDEDENIMASPSRSPKMTDEGNITDADRKAMAYELCSFRGETPHQVLRSTGAERWEQYLPMADAALKLAERLAASRVHPAGEPVAWRSVMNDPPIAVSVLARFFDNELGEWVYTVFDPGPVLLKMAGPYNEWLSLDTFNRPLYASIRAIRALTPGSPL